MMTEREDLLRSLHDMAGQLSTDPIRSQVEQLRRFRSLVERYEIAEVDRLRGLGATWPMLAPAFGVKTGQAVQQRVSRLRARVGGKWASPRPRGRMPRA